MMMMMMMNFKLDEINAKICCPTIGLLSQKGTGNL